MNSHSSLISSSTSTSPPGDPPSALIALRASFGRLKLVLLLDAPLPERADMAVPGRLLPESEVRRDDGPDVSAPVVEIGETERAPPSVVAHKFNSRAGISNQNCFNKSRNDGIHVYLYIQTSQYFICLSIVSNVGCFWLCDFHETVFLDFSQGKVLFIPLQATGDGGSDNNSRREQECLLRLGGAGRLWCIL